MENCGCPKIILIVSESFYFKARSDFKDVQFDFEGVELVQYVRFDLKMSSLTRKRVQFAAQFNFWIANKCLNL